MKPYYQDDGVTLYHGDATRHCSRHIDGFVMVTDPPYGINYKSNSPRVDLAASIEGDRDTSIRDAVLDVWAGSALVFGTLKAPAPKAERFTLIWDQGEALGMGDLTLPWKQSFQLIHVIGRDFEGRRTGAVLRFPPVQSMARNGRVHPHQKPVPLLQALIAKCAGAGIYDPFAGSGSTLVAAKAMGRRAVGIELDEHYCEIAAKRLAQGVLDFGASCEVETTP